jgi:hypothetical protein
MKTDKLYKKVGRKYVLYKAGIITDQIYAWMEPGFHMVHVSDNGSAFFYNVDPSKAHAKAFAREACLPKVLEAVKKECEFRPRQRKLSKKEQESFAKVKKIAGGLLDYLEGPSVQSIADACVSAVENYIVRINEN